MSGRPSILFPLFAGLETLEGIGPKTARNLSHIEIERPRDLLFTLPHSGIDRRRVPTVQGLELPRTASIEVTVGQHRGAARRNGPYRVDVEDAQTRFQLVFFHANTEYLQRQLPTG